MQYVSRNFCSKQLLREEAYKSCTGSDDIGGVLGCRIKIRLKHDTPIRKSILQYGKASEAKNCVVVLSE